MNPESLPLRDIHLPEAVGWWPLAPGWWLLVGIVLGIAGAIVWRATRLPSRRRRLALQNLNRSYVAWREHQNSPRLLTELSALLRQHAIAEFGRQGVAGLSGQAWIDQLNAGLDTAPFSDSISALLLQAAYRPTQEALSEAQVQDLLAACRQRLASPAR
ncbi:MAG: DUF4381 domain-containing protein [Pseudomonadota bacterium]